MKYEKWFQNNTASLQGKRVAVTGATGGLGEQLCLYLARLGAELILLNRNQHKTEQLTARLRGEHPTVTVHAVLLDLEQPASVEQAVKALETLCPHVLIHNAGAYSIPRHTTAQQVDNVFQINALSPYLMTSRLLKTLQAVGGHVIVVGSIAHNYSKIDIHDVDFSARHAASKVYGNAKRRLMLAEYERFRQIKGVTLSVVHPGVTFTNITAHYPKLVFAIIKHPMKVLFMPPKKAALSIVKGVFEPCEYGEWIGPRVFNVWGLPRKTCLTTFKRQETEQSYRDMKEFEKRLAFAKEE